MTPVTTVAGASEFEINESGFTKKLTLNKLFNFVNSSSTGWLSGGQITINTDTTKFNYASGTGIIVNAADPTNIVSTAISWVGANAVTPTYLATQGFTFLAINSSGALVQSSSFPVGGSLRDHIQLGGISHGNNTIIDAVSDFTSAVPYQIAPSLTDLQIALGVINTSGNVFSGAVAGNLTFAKTVGTIFYLGIASKLTPLTPNTKITPALNVPTITFSWRNGAGGFKTVRSTAITAGVYDNNSTGTTTAPVGSVTTNNWVNHRIRYSPDLESTIIEYGTKTYNSSANAVAGLLVDDFLNDNPQFTDVPVFGYLSLRGAGSNLTLSADAVFTKTNKFGMLN